MSYRNFLLAFALLLLPVFGQPAGEAAGVEALLASGTKHEEAGRLDDAARDYAAALVAAEELGDRKQVATASIAAGYLKYYRGAMDDALVDLRRGYDILGELGDAVGQRTALAYIAHVYADAKVGEYARAIEFYQQLLPQYEAAGATTSIADTLFNIASTYERKGDLAPALDWYRRALAAEQAIPRPDEAAFIKRSIGVTLGKLGRPAEALPLFAEAIAVFRAAGATDDEMMVRQSRGIVYRKLKRLPQAIDDLEATRAWFTANKNPRFLEKTEEELAAAYADAGRWREAYEARSRHAALQRELADQQREEHSAKLRVQFDTERAEQQTRALLKERAAAERIDRLQTAVLALGAAIIVVLGFTLARLMRDRRRMRDMAMTDELTRLPNRRHLLAVAEAQLARIKASGEAFALLALDVDHFKRINDQHGHGAGDLVLRRVAHACRVALRPGDLLGRTGGEEFFAVLPATREAEAAMVAERLRAAVEQLRFDAIDPALRVTVSLGVAEWRGDDTLVRLMARADERLYRAKEAGRNRVAAA
jgi:diguanylate cyclase (GGDEF)-like protein